MVVARLTGYYILINMHTCLSGRAAVLSLEILEQNHEFANLQEILLAVCKCQASYMYSLLRGATDEVKSATACITSICVVSKNNIGGF